MITKIYENVYKIEYTTQEVIGYLIEDNEITMEHAMEQFYMSDTFKKLSDVETEKRKSKQIKFNFIPLCGDYHE